ncbi:twin-arginine translocase subunit TatC [Pseudofulvimonas gallinarii]|uniref:twin-arginine translocase subunit TatC n=1 Tax=Pseudofulvimonas gallinarii TaxID=634155 RepID=UPI000F494185|nr:twin-arginine translocase subunit TatC [Pseudofulvimonas gallinarii]THD14716.1 hypothetical protein B1808_02210 [Pseudofulvimonas gallinarii]
MVAALIAANYNGKRSPPLAGTDTRRSPARNEGRLPVIRSAAGKILAVPTGPVATVIVVATGWLDVGALKRSRPYVIVGAFVVGAIVPPPDVLSQVMLAVPMCLLYEPGTTGNLARPGPGDLPPASGPGDLGRQHPAPIAPLIQPQAPDEA